jgi:hypothetical protein
VKDKVSYIYIFFFSVLFQGHQKEIPIRPGTWDWEYGCSS